VEQGINKWQVETRWLEGSGRTKGMLGEWVEWGRLEGSRRTQKNVEKVGCGKWKGSDGSV